MNGRLIVKTRTIYIIGKICQWKCEIFKCLNEPLKCGQWATVSFFIFKFLVREVTNMLDGRADLMEDILIRIVHSVLTYVMYSTNDPNTSTYFQLLVASLAYKRKSAEYYIEGNVIY